jgi:hypothetical protein
MEQGAKRPNVDITGGVLHVCCRLKVKVQKSDAEAEKRRPRTWEMYRESAPVLKLGDEKIHGTLREGSACRIQSLTPGVIRSVPDTNAFKMTEREFRYSDSRQIPHDDMTEFSAR